MGAGWSLDREVTLGKMIREGFSEEATFEPGPVE